MHTVRSKNRVPIRSRRSIPSWRATSTTFSRLSRILHEHWDLDEVVKAPKQELLADAMANHREFNEIRYPDHTGDRALG